MKKIQLLNSQVFLLKRKLITAMAFLLLQGAFCQAATAGVAATTAMYVDIFGVADPNSNIYLTRVHDIFEKIKRVSGVEISGAQLVIIESDNKPWAAALTDGHLVLTTGAIGIIYSAKSLETSDAWMAFVLGHEVAHLKNRDLWHHKVHAAIATNTSGDVSLQSVRRKIIESSQNPDQLKSLELKADEQGFFYASLAGYDTSRLFSGSHTEDDFLQYWVEQADTVTDTTHHNPSDRTQFLKTRLADIWREVDLFNYAVRLSHFARYDDALLLFSEFQKHFASEALLSNLGYVYLQLAREKMPMDIAYRFWFPTLLETDSNLPSTGDPDLVLRSFGVTIPPDALRDLEQSALLLSGAVEKFGGNLPAYVNLVVSYWYLEKMFKARAVVEDALERWPDNHQLLALRALVLLKQEPGVDMWPRAKDILESLVDSGVDDSNIIYNLATLLKERGRNGDAEKHWNQLLSDSSVLPYEYRFFACELIVADECDSDVQMNDQEFLEPPPIRIGIDIDDAGAREILANWNRLSRKIGSTQVDIFTHHNGDSLLALDYTVEIYTSRQSALSSVAMLKKYAGEPHSVLPTTYGAIWSYGSRWSALLENQIVTEVWHAK